jgi:glycosyltransferase involved in cell wall biosynthesis
MRVLFCHNYYQQPGGEDQVFADEAALLESRGHDVTRFTLHNDSIADRRGLAVACDAVWNRRVARALERLVRRRRVEVVHFHNTFPLISPAAYYAVRRAGAAVVQTLHNFRLLCPQATLFREGQHCESCVGRGVAWPSVLHRCYRNSLPASAATAAMLAAHRMLGTWRRAVHVYIALTQFARSKLIAGGLPAGRIVVKPNFILRAPPVGDGQGGYALFVGRLSPEKGIATLLAAWRLVGQRLPLRIVGDGPLADQVQKAALENSALRWLGRQPAAEVDRQMAGAALLVLPSQCPEGLPKVILESFARGTPVVASRCGGLPEIVGEGRTGRLFATGEPAALADCVRRLASAPHELAFMRGEARAEFERFYTAERNHELLCAAYARATAQAAVAWRRPQPAAEPVGGASG